MDSENDGLLSDNSYIVLSVEQYECHHGPDRNQAKKKKPEAVIQYFHRFRKSNITIFSKNNIIYLYKFDKQMHVLADFPNHNL